MAGNDDGDRIFSVGSPNGSHRSRIGELARKLAIAPRLSKGNRQQCLPYVILEFGSDQIELQRKRLSPTLEVLLQLSFSFEENRMIVIFDEGAQFHAFWIIVFPENGGQSLVAGNQLQFSYRRRNYFVGIVLGPSDTIRVYNS